MTPKVQLTYWFDDIGYKWYQATIDGKVFGEKSIYRAKMSEKTSLNGSKETDMKIASILVSILVLLFVTWVGIRWHERDVHEARGCPFGQVYSWKLDACLYGSRPWEKS